MEDSNNIIGVCGDCMNNKKDTFRILFKKEDIKINNYAKLRFTSINNKNEYMWVKITNILNDKFIGRLDNVPTLKIKMKYGDLLNFSYEEIFELLKDGD